MPANRHPAPLLLCVPTVLAMLLTTPVQACVERTPTQATSPGPHDYTGLPGSAQLWRDGDPGEPLFLRVRVLDFCSKPVVGERSPSPDRTA